MGNSTVLVSDLIPETRKMVGPLPEPFRTGCQPKTLEPEPTVLNIEENAPEPKFEHQDLPSLTR